MSVFVHATTGASGGQKRVLDPLELKLQGVVSHLMWVLGTKLKFSASSVCALTC